MMNDEPIACVSSSTVPVDKVPILSLEVASQINKGDVYNVELGMDFGSDHIVCRVLDKNLKANGYWCIDLVPAEQPKEI